MEKAICEEEPEKPSMAVVRGQPGPAAAAQAAEPSTVGGLGQHHFDGAAEGAATPVPIGFGVIRRHSPAHGGLAGHGARGPADLPDREVHSAATSWVWERRCC